MRGSHHLAPSGSAGVALQGMRRRGSTLVELTVGLCVASLVALMAATSLGAAGIAWHRHLASSRYEDRAWLALAAIVSDLETGSEWRMCTEARDCSQKSAARKYSMPMLLAGKVGWLVADELRRCDKACETYVEGVAAIEVIADMVTSDGLTTRRPFLQWHDDSAVGLEVILTMRDHRRFSRVVSRTRPGP